MDGPVCVCVSICASVCHKPAFCPNGYACVITQTRHRIYCSCIWHEISWWNSAGVTPSRREKHTRVKKQVWVQLPASADNVALPAFAAARCSRAAIDRYLLPAGPTAANPQRHVLSVHLSRASRSRRKLSCQNQLDSFSRFDRTPTYDRQTDRHS